MLHLRPVTLSHCFHVCPDQPQGEPNTESCNLLAMDAILTQWDTILNTVKILCSTEYREFGM